MKASHSMCGPHEDSDIIFGPVRHFGWTWLCWKKRNRNEQSKIRWLGRDNCRSTQNDKDCNKS